MATYSKGKGGLIFYNSNGITRSAVPLFMKNKIKFLDQDNIYTVYWEDIQESSNAFIHRVTCTTLHNPYHQHLCHTRYFSLDHGNKIIDNIPFIYNTAHSSAVDYATQGKRLSRPRVLTTNIFKQLNMDNVSTWIMGLSKGGDTTK